MSFQSVDEIIRHYRKVDKPIQEHDRDLIQEERQERYNRALQRRLASCGDREYPNHLARQDILEGIEDISEQE